MSYLIDTDVLIDFLAGRPIGLAVMRQLASAEISMSVITVGEYYVGVHRSKSPDVAHERFVTLTNDIVVRDIDELVVRRYAFIRAALMSKGAVLDDFDLLIAATAIEKNLTLVTRNLKHFNRVAGLKLLLFPPSL